MAKKFRKETLNYGALTKELEQKGPQKLYMLWGPEDYLISDFLNRLRAACVGEGMEDFDAKRLDGAAIEPPAVEEALNAMPFFGGRTFLELRGFDVNKCRDEKMAALLEDIPDWCTVVITLPTGVAPDGRLSFIKQLKKSGRAVEFTPQDGDLLHRWISRRFASAGKRIDPAAADRLIMLSGELMNQLIPEIDKICAYTSAERVTINDVESIAHHIPEADVFEMTKCLARGDYDGAAAFLSELLAGDREPIELMGTIGWQIRRLYGAKVILSCGGNISDVRETFGINSDYALRELKESVDRLSLSELTNDVRHTAEYSMKFREQGAVITETESLKELLIRFAMENRHAAS